MENFTGFSDEWLDIFAKVTRLRVPLLFVERIDFKNDDAFSRGSIPSFVIPHYNNEHILENQFLDLIRIDQTAEIIYKFDKIIEAVSNECNRYLKKKTT